MKEKERWARNEIENNFACSIPINPKDLHRAWLAGFEFARQEAADLFRTCEGTTAGVEDLGEEEIYAGLKPAEKDTK